MYGGSEPRQVLVLCAWEHEACPSRARTCSLCRNRALRGGLSAARLAPLDTQACETDVLGVELLGVRVTDAAEIVHKMHTNVVKGAAVAWPQSLRSAPRRRAGGEVAMLSTEEATSGQNAH